MSRRAAGRRHEPDSLSRHLEFLLKLVGTTLFVAQVSIQLKTTKVPSGPEGKSAIAKAGNRSYNGPRS